MTTPASAPWLELRLMHQTIQGIHVLAEQPKLVMIYQGQAWHHRDFIALSLRFACLAKQQGLDTKAYERWFERKKQWLHEYGLSWQS